MRAPVLRTLGEQVDPAHTAVIVIDVQKDFCATDGGMGAVLGLDMSSIQAASKTLDRFIEGARAADVPVVWVREVFSPDRMMPNHRLLNGEGDDLLLIREGTDGTDWYSGIGGPRPGEAVITKWNYDAFHETDLNAWLRAHGIVTLVMTGFTTNVCVETTARHGYLEGYYIVTLSDCTGAPDPVEHAAAIVNLGKYFGSVTTSDDVLGAWARQPADARDVLEAVDHSGTR